MSADPLIDQLFASLYGHWLFDRTIEGAGTMSGRASFTPLVGGPRTGAVFLYREDGVLRLNNGRELPAFREFIYRLDNGAIVVEFHHEPLSKGVLFRLEPGFAAPEPWPSSASAEHVCRDDVYRGTYIFESRDCFRTYIRIDGPEKADRIVTIFSRP